MMGQALLEVRNLAHSYPIREGIWPFQRTRSLRAVDDVSFSVRRGSTFGLVGESGCGKSTTGRLVLGVTKGERGDIRYEGTPVSAERDEAWRLRRRRMQLVYQDPLSALDRRLTVGTQLMEPLKIHGIGSSETERRSRATSLVSKVGLNADLLSRYPHELSGGQRQRVVLARALMLEPSLLVCDEAVSALDVSIQAQVINLLLELQEEFGLSYLFISHDLEVVNQISHEVAVMYLGRIVESGAPDLLFREPAHPYTQALVAAVPTAHRRGQRRVLLKGEPPSPIDRPGGCAFHPRCPLARSVCRIRVPELKPLDRDRRVACHVAHGEADSMQ